MPIPRAPIGAGRRAIVTLVAALGLSSAPASIPEDERWLWDDTEFQALEVNGGELEFHPTPPAGAIHHQTNTIDIRRRSLTDGWVGLLQCHENLDPVGAAQILFDPSRVRRLEVVSRSAIGRAWVEGSSIQLADIAPGARLCLRAESRALQRRGGGWVLRDGPWSRRFLDGYYPMHVSLVVRHPGLELAASSPVEQPGYDVQAGPGETRIEAWFSGRLVAEVRLDLER